MLYMPATTLATPVVLQETQPKLLTATTRYYMVQPTPVVPTIPLLNTGFVYPAYGLVTKSVEQTIDTNKSQISQVTQPVQHVIHHHVSTCSEKTCPGYCELCCPWGEESRTRSRSRSCSCTRSRSRSRSPSPPTRDHQLRYSRRDQYDNKHETIDEKIERIRRELATTSFSKTDKATETIDYYHPPPRPKSPTVEFRVPYKQHYDAPKPRSSSRSRSRPRSASSQRASSLPREPWRSSNQNDYPWRDSHLPAYREATLARSQTPDSRSWKETAHERSHINTQNSTSYYSGKEYAYRPKSETEARKWYIQSTGKNPDSEVYQSLRGGTTTYTYTGSSTPCYDTHQCKNYHVYCSDAPTTTTTTKVHTLKQIDTTPCHTLYGCNEPCLHIVPKQGGTLDPPYLKILNSPVTYLH